MTLSERGIAKPTVGLSDLLKGHRRNVGGSCLLDLAGYTQAIVASGFPGLQGLPDRVLRARLNGYLQRIVDRDFAEFGQQVRNPAALRRWLTAYAAATSTTATYEKIRDAATGGHDEKPARSTTLPYRDALEAMWIIDPVPAWLPTGHSPLRTLAQVPKHHLVDPALAARLLGAGPDALLQGRAPGPKLPRNGTLLGHLFESLVTLCVRVYAQAAEATVGHLRTWNGRHEIDLIVERDDHRVLAAEVKLARTVGDADVRHLHWLSGQLGDDLLDAVVITTGPDAYRRRDGIAVVPAGLLGP